METSRTDGALGGDTLTPYDFAMEELGIVSSNLARALLARKGAVPEAECAEARQVYGRLMRLHSRLRLEPSQHDALGQELGLLRSRLEECEDDAGKG